jgi:hypothetical protein
LTGAFSPWLGHFNISQTSTYFGASIGGDEQDMRAFEEKIGRQNPFTHIHIPDSQTAPNRATTDRPTIKTPNENRMRHDPTPTIH